MLVFASVTSYPYGSWAAIDRSKEIMLTGDLDTKKFILLV